MGHKFPEGSYTPQSAYDIKLYLATELAYKLRTEIRNELSYNASAGISHNKTLAKLGGS
jgi:DNA polymerase eta